MRYVSLSAYGIAKAVCKTKRWQLFVFSIYAGFDETGS